MTQCKLSTGDLTLSGYVKLVKFENTFHRHRTAIVRNNS
jgi:hypothetical protein